MLLDLKDAFDGAHRVVFADSGRTAVVWSGGTTFNVYGVEPTGGVIEVDVFSVSDDKGRPVDPDTAQERMTEYLEREITA